MLVLKRHQLKTENQKMTQFTKYQKITMAALVGALLFNPMVIEILDQYFKIAYTALSVACTVWVLSFLLYKVLKPEQVKVPKKTKKQHVKSSDYIETDI